MKEPRCIKVRIYTYIVLENSDKGFNKFLDIWGKPLKCMLHLKNIYIRGNNSPFMNRILSKEIMKRSRLKNKFLKSKSEADKKNYVNPLSASVAFI